MGRTIMRENKVGETILCAYTACFHDLTKSYSNQENAVLTSGETQRIE